MCTYDYIFISYLQSMYVNLRCTCLFRMSVEELIYTVYKNYIYIYNMCFCLQLCLARRFVCDLFFALGLFGLRSGHTIHESFATFRHVCFLSGTVGHNRRVIKQPIHICIYLHRYSICRYIQLFILLYL